MSTNPTPVELKPCAWCNGPAVNVGGDYITCGAAWNPGCAGHMVRTDAETWNDRAEVTCPPAPAAPVDELVERTAEMLRNEAQGIRDGHPCADQGLLERAADQLTIYARRVAELEGALQFYARENSWKSCTAYMCGHGAINCNAMADKGSKARAALTGEQG